MASSRSAPQSAFVLHQWDWSETSLILDLFTREQGRVAAVAKGAKRPYSQLRPVLMPFQRLLVLTTRPKADEHADILLLRSAEYAGAGAALPPSRLFPGFYLNELLMKLLARGDPHPALFDAYADALQALAVAPDEAPLRAFELLLLREIGLLPALDAQTMTLQPLVEGQRYSLVAEGGLVLQEAGGGRPALQAGQWQALWRALQEPAPFGPTLRQAADSMAGLKPQLRAKVRLWCRMATWSR